MQTLVPSFRRIILNPREPSLKISLHLNLSREEREARCKLLGVANVASVQLGELTESFGPDAPGTLAALFEASEGQVLHLATGAPYVEPPPPSTPVTPPATSAPTPEESIAAAVNSHDDVKEERRRVSVLAASWKEEAQGLAAQLEAALTANDAHLRELAREVERSATAEMQVTAIKAALVVAVEDRNALVERLKVERALSAATSSTENDTDEG